MWCDLAYLCAVIVAQWEVFFLLLLVVIKHLEVASSGATVVCDSSFLTMFTTLFCLPISQISEESDSQTMSTSSLRRQVKNIVHNYSEAEIKVCVV